MANKENNTNNENKMTIKGRLIQQLTDNFDVPRETLLDIPILTLEGNTHLRIENFEGILEYGELCIKLKTKCGVLVIEGKKLFAKSMDSEVIKINGFIHAIRFEK